ncbi:chemotaxis protein CheW [Synechocystis sp. LKSZ1]|uniref:chemotaxis protein CheW n=1 Tax=Synechocystis sp. LKSZ1 TaxID=3144951 RepID=UPI00336BDEDA
MVKDFFWVELTSALSLAIPLEQTAEVLSMGPTELCPVPGIKPAFLGVSNQRGQLLWVIDLNHLLGEHKAPARRVMGRTVGIVLLKDSFRVAGLVAKLNGIISLDLNVSGQAPQRPCLQAQTRIDGQSVGILDVDAVFQALQGPNPTPISLVSSSH